MSNLRWTGGKIPEEDFDQISYFAAHLGRTPRSLIPEIFEKGLEAMAASMKDPPLETRLWLRLKAIKKQTRIQDMLHELGYFAQAQESESIMDDLQTFCAEMEIDVTDLLDSIDMTQQPRSVDIRANGNSVRSCMSWLSGFMRVGEQYFQYDIAEKAETLGFSEYALKSAKRKLGIDSLKAGKHWIWQWQQSDNDDHPHAPTILTTEDSIPDSIQAARSKIRAGLNGDHAD